MTDHSHHGEHEHHRFQAHHFDTGEQQFQAGKLGMWLFLATEILFFSGMFCAYAVFRANHPEIFENASGHLDTLLGAANTLVLLASSLTVAWAVRCAQLNKKAGIVYNLVFTLICAGIFMGVKAVEYSLKFEEGLLWRSAYTFDKSAGHPDLTQVHEGLQNFGLVALAAGVALIVLGYLLGGDSAARRWTFWALGATVLGVGGGALAGNAWTIHKEEQNAAAHGHDHAHAEEHGDTHEEHAEDPASIESEGTDAGKPSTDAAPAQAIPEDSPALETTPGEGAIDPTPDELLSDENDASDQHDQIPPEGVILPPLEGASADAPAADQPVTIALTDPVPFRGEGKYFPGMFFSIYYAMTGVHAIHILAGIGVIVWIVSRAAAGHFEPEYYGPVEYVGLYWHLVDLIWIYLFPLLYLI
jgi:cytochrome c oxidase subunit 3